MTMSDFPPHFCCNIINVDTTLGGDQCSCNEMTLRADRGVAYLLCRVIAQMGNGRTVEGGLGSTIERTYHRQARAVPPPLPPARGFSSRR